MGRGHTQPSSKPGARNDAAARISSGKDAPNGAAAAASNGTAGMAVPAGGVHKTASWASIASQARAAPAAQPAPKPAAAGAASAPGAATSSATASAPPVPAVSSGVTLPKGVAPATERQPSFKFGEIDPAEIAQASTTITPTASQPSTPPSATLATSQPRPPPAVAAPAASTPAAVVYPPSEAPAGSARPINYAAAATASTAPPPPPPASAAGQARPQAPAPAAAAGPATPSRQVAQQHAPHGAANPRQGGGPRAVAGRQQGGYGSGQQQQQQQMAYSPQTQFGTYMPNPAMAGYAGMAYPMAPPGAGYPFMQQQLDRKSVV